MRNTALCCSSLVALVCFVAIVCAAGCSSQQRGSGPGGSGGEGEGVGEGEGEGQAAWSKEVPLTAAQGGRIEVTAADDAQLAGTALDVPAGALPHDLTIRLSRGPGLESGPGEAAVSPELVVEPHGLVLQASARLTLPFALARAGEQARPGDLRLRIREPGGLELTLQSPQLQVDPDAGTAQVLLPGFSSFQLFARSFGACHEPADCTQYGPTVSCCTGWCRDIATDDDNCGVGCAPCNREGEICRDGLCQPGECRIDGDCTAPMLCQEGRCECPPGGGYNCGRYCAWLAQDPENCGGCGNCDGTIGHECGLEFHVGPEQACCKGEITDGTSDEACGRSCLPCAEGEHCQGGVCVTSPPECDPPCPDGQWCDNGECKPRGGGQVCFAHEDCPDAQVCDFRIVSQYDMAGACVPDGCVTARDCPPPQRNEVSDPLVCSAGHCLQWSEYLAAGSLTPTAVHIAFEQVEARATTDGRVQIDSTASGNVEVTGLQVAPPPLGTAGDVFVGQGAVHLTSPSYVDDFVTDTDCVPSRPASMDAADAVCHLTLGAQRNPPGITGCLDGTEVDEGVTLSFGLRCDKTVEGADGWSIELRFGASNVKTAEDDPQQPTDQAAESASIFALTDLPSRPSSSCTYADAHAELPCDAWPNFSNTGSWTIQIDGLTLPIPQCSVQVDCQG